MTGYVVEYCYCAFAFLLVILWNCFTTRQFPGFSYKMFRLEMVLALAYVVFDMSGAYTIPMAKELPAWINYAINTVYYFLQVLIPAGLYVFVLSLIGFKYKQIPVRSMIPLILAQTVVLTNPIHGMLFTVDAVDGYSLRHLFNLVYGCDLFYIVLTLATMNIYRKRISKKEYNSITLFILITIGMMVFQYFYPLVLLSSPAIAISVTLMYLTIQKPEDMLDVTSGVFNRTAMMRIVDTYIGDRQEFNATLIVLSNVSRLDRVMGYESLNRLMAEIGCYLSNSLPHSLAFRLSGSTLFVILSKHRDEYDRIAESLRERFSEAWLTDEYNIVLPVSVISVESMSSVSSADEFSLLINYLSETFGDRPYYKTNFEALETVKRRQYIEKALQDALDNDLFEIYMQPIYSIKDGMFTHAEALLRLNWNGEKISPGEFIPVAEQNGLMQRIDDLVFDKVCLFIKSLTDEEAHILHSIGINMSALEFMRPDLTKYMHEIVQKYDIDPSLIAIEMTETAASGSLTETHQQMLNLKSCGFKVTLDDFGTGFANITQVVHLPFDIAKLDRSILVDDARDNLGSSVMRHSIEMFKEMGMEVIAEGAEDKRDVERLNALGVDYIQGFYYAKPMPLSQFRRFLVEKH